MRHGHHCTMPLHECLGVPATVRASFGLYNTREDVDALIDASISQVANSNSVNSTAATRC